MAALTHLLQLRWELGTEAEAEAGDAEPASCERPERAPSPPPSAAAPPPPSSRHSITVSATRGTITHNDGTLSPRRIEEIPNQLEYLSLLGVGSSHAGGAQLSAEATTLLRQRRPAPPPKQRASLLGGGK